jgi:serine/threonine protein kinase
LQLTRTGESYTYNNIIDDYQLIRSLGEGGFGKVMLGRHKEKGNDVAIKYMDISENCKLFSLFQVAMAGSLDEIYKEAESLQKLKHKNIIELHHAFA